MSGESAKGPAFAEPFALFFAMDGGLIEPAGRSS